MFFATNVFADDRTFAVTQALTQVQEKKSTAGSWEGRNSDQPYVTLLSEYETIIKADWSFDETYHVRIRVQKDSGKELGQWPVYYNKSREEVKEIKAFVEAPDGKKFEATDIQDVVAFDNSPMYADMMVKIITLPQINIGSMLDVTVKTRTKHKAIQDQFFDEVVFPTVPTKFARFTFIFPENKNIQFKSYHQPYKPIIEKSNGKVKYSFVFEETKELKQEELMPPIDEMQGGLYLSSIDNWKDVADWYRRLVTKNIVEDEVIVAKVKELIKDAQTPMQKARAIVEFIQNSFRYVALNFGDHTVDPHQVTEIYRNRYGDCKDLSILTKYMFEIAGIPSSMCLMNSEFSPNPVNVLPNPSIFEHVMLEAAIDGKKYFIDPQLKGFDLGQLPADYDNANVMVIDDTGDFRFDHLPIALDDAHALTSKSDVTIQANGSAIFDVHVTLPIEASQGFRSQWASMSDDDKNKFYAGLQSSFAQGGKMISHEVKGIEQRYGPLEFLLKYSSSTVYPVVNDMVLLKEQQQNDLPTFAEDDRMYPIFFPTNSVIKTTYVYHAGDGLKVDFIPKGYTLSFDFVDISVDYTAEDNTVTMNAIYSIKRSLIPPERYKEVKVFREQLSKKNDQYIVLKKK